MAAQTLLDRLDGVKRVGDGRWMARCPAHDDRTPSLSVRELSDGRVLIHCWSGCGAEAVMKEAGLEMTDLFPDGPLYHHAKRVLRRNEQRAYFESVVEIAQNDLRAGRPFSEQDRQTVREAAKWLQSHPETGDMP